MVWSTFFGVEVPQSARLSVGGCKSYLGNAQMPLLAILLGLPLTLHLLVETYVAIGKEKNLPGLTRTSRGVGDTHWVHLSTHVFALSFWTLFNYIAALWGSWKMFLFRIGKVDQLS